MIATDNGDAMDFIMFSSHDSTAFNSLALSIIKSKGGRIGPVVITTGSDGLPAFTCAVIARRI